MEEAGDQAGEHTCQEGTQHGDPDVAAVHHQHDADRAAGAEGAIHRQVRQVQDPVGDVQADGHNAPDQTLGNGTGHSI